MATKNTTRYTAADTDDDLQQQSYNPALSGKLGAIGAPTGSSPNRLFSNLFSGVNKIVLAIKITLFLFVLWAIVQGIIGVCNWWTDTSNTYHYGPTRTFATTAVLGINNDSTANPSDIVASNVRGNILITVIPAGDASKAQTYFIGLRLVGDSVSKTPVSVTVSAAPKGGRPSIVIHIDGQSATPTLTPDDKGGFNQPNRK